MLGALVNASLGLDGVFMALGLPCEDCVRYECRFDGWMGCAGQCCIRLGAESCCDRICGTRMGLGLEGQERYHGRCAEETFAHKSSLIGIRSLRRIDNVASLH